MFMTNRSKSMFTIIGEIVLARFDFEKKVSYIFRDSGLGSYASGAISQDRENSENSPV